VIIRFDCNSETAFTKERLNLVSISYVVLNCYSVVAFAVIEAKIEVFFIITVCRSVRHLSCVWLRGRFDLLNTFSKIIDVRVVQDFCFFIVIKIRTKMLQTSCRSHGYFR